MQAETDDDGLDSVRPGGTPCCQPRRGVFGSPGGRPTRSVGQALGTRRDACSSPIGAPCCANKKATRWGGRQRHPPAWAGGLTATASCRMEGAGAAGGAGAGTFSRPFAGRCLAPSRSRACIEASGAVPFSKRPEKGTAPGGKGDSPFHARENFHSPPTILYGTTLKRGFGCEKFHNEKLSTKFSTEKRASKPIKTAPKKVKIDQNRSKRT